MDVQAKPIKTKGWIKGLFRLDKPVKKGTVTFPEDVDLNQIRRIRFYSALYYPVTASLVEVVDCNILQIEQALDVLDHLLKQSPSIHFIRLL